MLTFPVPMAMRSSVPCCLRLRGRLFSGIGGISRLSLREVELCTGRVNYAQIWHRTSSH
jgi:hypothetical protein